jgi:MYXO-CTERM domain-containing protein
MRTQLGSLCVVVAASGFAASAHAEMVEVVGGQTSVLLDLELIGSVTDLVLTGVSNDTIVPGNLGPDSVAFAITSPDAASNPTTFMYDTDDFITTFSGTIAHRGTITFNDSITLGNFDIGFDEGLGVFTVSDTFFDGTGIGALFSIGLPLTISPLEQTFDLTGDLLITQHFATILLDLGLTDTDLTGADVGDAFVQGFNQAVPGPGPLMLAAVAAIGARRRRR